MDIQIECLVDIRALVGEGPVWDIAGQCLWWTDIEGRRMHRFDPSTGTNTSFTLAVRVGSFALREAGGFALAAEHGFWLWDAETGKLDHLHDVDDPAGNTRMNDGRCDRQGRFVASSMSLDAPRKPDGGCWRLGPDHRSEMLFGGLHVGNGIAFSPSGDRFYVADTPSRTVLRRDYDPATGALGTPQTFAEFGTLAGAPDGAIVDAAGRYWVAGVNGGCLHCFTPDGKLERTVTVPVEKPTCPAFGGKALDELYFTSIATGTDAPQAGGLFRITGLGITGLPEPRFRG